MSNVTESFCEAPTTLPLPIADMRPGFFWARDTSVFPNGRPISDLEVQVRLRVAYDNLVAIDPPSPGVS